MVQSITISLIVTKTRMFSFAKISLSVLLVQLFHAEAAFIDNDLSELSFLNTSVDPCENFFEFACGNFKNVHPRPDDPLELVSDPFQMLGDKLANLARDILSTPNAEEDPEALNKVKAAYKACVDTEYSDTLENPEIQLINEVNGFPMVTSSQSESHKFGWSDIADLAANWGVPLIFTITIIPLQTDATKIYIHIKNESLPNLSLFKPENERTYEETIDESMKQMALNYDENSLLRSEGTENLMPFDIFLRNITLKLRDATQNFGTSDTEIYENIDQMAAFMRQLYFGGIPDDSIPEFENIINNSISIGGLQDWTDKHFKGIEINWLDYFSRVFNKSGAAITEKTELLVYSNMSTTLYGILNLVQQTDPRIVKNFALMRIFLYMAPDSDAMTREAFEQYYKKINIKLYPRWEYCTRKLIDTDGAIGLSYATAYGYQRYHFNINKIASITEMIQEIQLSFSNLMDENDWMDEESKKRALTKVEKMISLLAYPEEIVENGTALDKFYENLRICTWENYGNTQRLRSFKQALHFASIDKAQKRDTWDKPPFTVNAYYNRANNRIIMPIAILNPLFFTGDVSVMDYAHIGSVIGHEITHGFDDAGSAYNENGIRESWWSTATKTAFDIKKKCFEDQYFKYLVDETNSYVNGTATLNENIADNGGTRVSYYALQNLNRRTRNALKTSTYTNEQLFFIGYATTWCWDPSLEYVAWVQKSEHAVNKWRVNGVLSNMEEFSRAFQCPIGSVMNPESKCKLW